MGESFSDQIAGRADSIDDVDPLKVKKWVDDLRFRPSRHDLSRHLLSEIVVSHMIGRRLPPDAPIPGCDCETCETRRVGP